MSVNNIFLNETIKFNYINSTNITLTPTQAVLIAFQIGRIISILCIIFGILGNLAIIITIYRSSFCYFPYGLLLIFLATFDIIRLLSTIYYYLIQANLVILTLKTLTLYVVFYRIPKFVTNWLKVILAIERLLAVKYWINHRYNIRSNNAKLNNFKQQKKTFLFILLLIISCCISQHPNFLSNRFISTYIDPTRLFIVNIVNKNFYYGKILFNGVLFTIISYIILDDLAPIIILMILNTLLLHELKNLPPLTSKKLSESILILCFLTFFSIFVVPRSFIVFFNLYGNQAYINQTIISVVFHTVQGTEIIIYLKIE